MITYLVSYSCSSNQCWRHFEGLLLIILPILMKNYSAVHQKCPTCRCHWQECKNPTLFETIAHSARTISENMNRHETGQQSLFLIEFKVATLLVKCLKLAKVIDSSKNEALISYCDQQWNSSVFQFITKKHTFDSESTYKLLHLAHPARMLLRIFVYWHKTIVGKMKQKTLASRR